MLSVRLIRTVLCLGLGRDTLSVLVSLRDLALSRVSDKRSRQLQSESQEEVTFSGVWTLTRPFSCITAKPALWQGSSHEK